MLCVWSEHNINLKLSCITIYMSVLLCADTAATLKAQETMWPGFYEVQFLIKDQQGELCPEPQKVKVLVCTCEDGVTCGRLGGQGQQSKEAEFGPAGIGMLFLGLLMLLRKYDVAEGSYDHTTPRDSIWWKGEKVHKEK